LQKSWQEYTIARVNPNLASGAGSKQDMQNTKKTFFEDKDINPVDNNNKLVCSIEYFHQSLAQHHSKVESLLSKMNHAPFMKLLQKGVTPYQYLFNVVKKIFISLL